MNPGDETSANTLNDRLRAEAATLRRNRRLFHRVMFLYVSLGAAFVMLRVCETLATLQPHAVRLVAARPNVAVNSSGQLRYAFDSPTVRPAVVPGTAVTSVPTVDAPSIEWSRAWTEVPWGIAALVALLGGGVFKATRGAMRRQKRAARLLVQFDGKAAAGLLAEVLRIDDADIRATAERALIRLLPQLRATDGSLLDDEQHACLNRALMGRNADLSLAILQAWEQVGDERDEATVLRLADGEGVAGKNRALREAADACIPYVRANAGRRRTESTLLRACDDSSDYTLLRAANPAPTTDNPSLLRSV